MSMNLNLQYESKANGERLSFYDLIQTPTKVTEEIMGEGAWEKYDVQPTLERYLKWVQTCITDEVDFAEYTTELEIWIDKQPNLFKSKGEFCWYIS